MGEGGGRLLETKQEPFKGDRCFRGRKLLWRGSGVFSCRCLSVAHTGEKIELLWASARSFCSYRVQMGHSSKLVYGQSVSDYGVLWEVGGTDPRLTPCMVPGGGEKAGLFLLKQKRWSQVISE